MADIEPPSFSLGLDLDAEPEPQILTRHHQQSGLNSAPGRSSCTLLQDDNDDGYFQPRVTNSEEDDFGLQVMDSDPEDGPDSPRIFKRLRRGPAIEEPRLKNKEKDVVCCDDEIEEFSSQEDLVRGNNARPFFCGSFVYVLLEFFWGFSFIHCYFMHIELMQELVACRSGVSNGFNQLIHEPIFVFGSVQRIRKEVETLRSDVDC